MIGSSFVHYIQPMRKFLDGDMKMFTREKAALESQRLDLDSCKSRVRKARSMLGQQAVRTVGCVCVWVCVRLYLRVCEWVCGHLQS